MAPLGLPYPRSTFLPPLARRPGGLQQASNKQFRTRLPAASGFGTAAGGAAGGTTGEVSTTGVSRPGGVVGGTGGGGTAPPEREARVGLGLATGGISVGELARICVYLFLA